jgi:hypothetical protein
MAFSIRDVRDGVGDGIKRANQHFTGLPYSLDQDAEGKLARVLEPWPIEYNPRFVRLFSELVTIADAARSKYNEPPLTEGEVRGFLAHSSSFFNSFTHR